MALRDFPVELLTKVFLNLSYESLLSVSAVCAQWNELVAQDPALSVQTFKRLSTVYVPPGCYRHDSGEKRRRDESVEGSEPVRLHPALNKTAYVMGHDLPGVCFNTGNALVDLALANDFVSIPVVTMVRIEVPQRLASPNGFKIKIINAKGVRMIDLFKGLVTESNREVLTKNWGLMTRAELLGDQLYYEGMSTVRRTGLGLSAQLYLGSGGLLEHTS